MRNRDLPPLKPIGFAMAAVVAGLAPAAEAQAAPRARVEPTRMAEPARALAQAAPEVVAPMTSAPVAVLSSPSEWAQGELFGGGLSSPRR
ncbi:MAG: hypothetical protein JNJ73_21620 [Hyphomonadaceae bacterium]|nr:hypothetical protein [Hyphomonadaceae bacterium]